MSETAIIERIPDAHPKEILTGDRVKCGRDLWVTVKHVWRTGPGPYDNTWIEWDAYYPFQISHASRVLIERPAPSDSGSEVTG